ncbi:MAG: biopolymer transporter ExbD [Bacteroidaceae bacterium]|nr:biopolymer transporter ExbD [Bacteroidaceae bacterium]
MAKGNRKVPDINSSSTADIAFLLLIFFLITTSMDTDRGLVRKLPPPPEKDQKQTDMVAKKRNVLIVKINMNNEIMCGDSYITVDQLKNRVKEFILNENGDENLPELSEKNIPIFGKVMLTAKHVISLQNDRGTSYDAYIGVQNEIVAAYNDLRNEVSQKQFGKSYSELTEDQQAAVRQYYPQKISEAEPKSYGGK